MGWGNKWDDGGCVPPHTKMEIPNDSMFIMTDKLIELKKQTEKDLLKITGLDDVKKLYEQNWSDVKPEEVYVGWDIGKKDDETVAITGTVKDGILNIDAEYRGEAAKVLIESYARVLNKKPTHDPYTNPNAHIYYECSCGAILDPQTKSFAALNNCASANGWKIRFSDKGYTPYCVKCGEGVE